VVALQAVAFQRVEKQNSISIDLTVEIRLIIMYRGPKASKHTPLILFKISKVNHAMKRTAGKYMEPHLVLNGMNEAITFWQLAFCDILLVNLLFLRIFHSLFKGFLNVLYCFSHSKFSVRLRAFTAASD
jgi:hypothetical protein